MDCFGVPGNDDTLHGPRSSAERLTQRKTRKAIDNEKQWLKKRAQQLKNQQPKVCSY